MSLSLPIGVIDSGLGGLTVLKLLKKRFPQEVFYFFADNAFAPYGNKSSIEIQDRLLRLLDFFKSYPVKMVILACHTASVTCLKCPLFLAKLSQYPFTVLGMISPSVFVVQNASFKHCLVLGTQRTIDSGVYQKALFSSPERKISFFSHPRLATLIETHFNDLTILKEHLAVDLSRYFIENVDAILLGCTHYPMIENLLRQLPFKSLLILDPADRVCFEVEKLLLEEKKLSEQKVFNDLFFLTMQDLSFCEKIERFLQEKIIVRLVNLENPSLKVFAKI